MYAIEDHCNDMRICAAILCCWGILKTFSNSIINKHFPIRYHATCLIVPAWPWLITAAYLVEDGTVGTQERIDVSRMQAPVPHLTAGLDVGIVAGQSVGAGEGQVAGHCIVGGIINVRFIAFDLLQNRSDRKREIGGRGTLDLIEPPKYIVDCSDCHPALQDQSSPQVIVNIN